MEIILGLPLKIQGMSMFWSVWPGVLGNQKHNGYPKILQVPWVQIANGLSVPLLFHLKLDFDVILTSLY